MFQSFLSEGWLVVEVARTAATRWRGTGPRIVEGVVAAPTTTATATTTGAEAATAAATGTARHLLHLRCGIPQRRADLVDFQLDDGALLTLAGLVRPLLEPAGDDDASAPLERLGDMLGRLPPH